MVQSHTSGKGQVESSPNGWKLTLFPQESGYALAQVDDYTGLPRSAFPHHAGIRLQVRMQASRAHIPGTWGFGLWNDPFSLSLGFGGGTRRLPALPNAAWFFFASPQNHLSFRDDQPGCGALASAFSSPGLPPLLLGAAIPALGAALWHPAGRALRHLAGRVIQQDNHTLEIDVTQEHLYALHWHAGGISWEVDGKQVHHSTCSPRPPLGLVLWVDNQYAAWRPDGRIQFGVLPVTDVLEIRICDFLLTHD